MRHINKNHSIAKIAHIIIIFAFFLNINLLFAFNDRITLFEDALNGSTKGIREGGEFVKGGGWRAINGKDRIIIKLPKAATDGAIVEIDLKNFNVPAQIDAPENKILELYEGLGKSGGDINTPNSDMFVIHAGTKYPQFKLKYHTHGFSRQEDTYQPIKSFDPKHTYKIKIEWKNGIFSFSIDGNAFYIQNTPAVDPFDRTAYIVLGSLSGYPILRGVIYSNIKVTIPKPTDLTAPYDLHTDGVYKTNILLWEPPFQSKGLVGYEVCSNDSLYQTLIGGTQYVIRGNADKRSSFKVRAIYANNKKSQFSNVVDVVSQRGYIEAIRNDTSLTIDGKLDDKVWNLGNWRAGLIHLKGNPNNEVSFSSSWDAKNLYFAFKIKDNILKNDSKDYTKDDAIELLIDGNNCGASGRWGYRDFDNYDRLIALKWNDTGIYYKNGKEKLQFVAEKSIKGLITKLIPVDGGYNVEVAISWENLGITPIAGMNIGFDFRQYDDDNSSDDNINIITWSSNSTNSLVTTVYGDIILAE